MSYSPRSLPTASRARVAQVGLALIGLALGGCLYDADARCGPAMTFVAAAYACVCESHAAPVVGGCTPCAADEVVAGGMCACPTGQTKNASDLCVTVAGLGDACDTSSAPCTDPVYAYCAAPSGSTAGTCTRSCTTDTDCGAAYTCATWEAQPYCRTFEGVGAACVANADCTGDAAYCDTFQTHTCVVQGCSLTDNDCPRDLTCCDFSGYGLGTLCAGACS